MASAEAFPETSPKARRLVGLLSDTHGRAEMARCAATVLARRGIDLLIHLGDIGSEDVLEALVAPRAERAAGAAPLRLPIPIPPPNPIPTPIPTPLPIPVWTPEVHIVLGNVDHDADRLAARAAELGIAVHPRWGRVEVAGKAIAFLHGHDARSLAEAVASRPDYVCQGHTHVASDVRSGRIRWLNPGALHRVRVPTVGWLDPVEDRFELLEVPREERR